MKKKAFFLITIRFISQKCIIFASSFEKRHKITIKFLIIQTNFKIMKTNVSLSVKQKSMRNSVLSRAFKMRDSLESMLARYCRFTPGVVYCDSDSYDSSANAILCAIASLEEFIENNDYEI